VVFVGFIPRAEAVPTSASPRTPAASSQKAARCALRQPLRATPPPHAAPLPLAVGLLGAMCVEAWQRAQDSRADDGSLPPGSEIARQHGRHERWGDWSSVTAWRGAEHLGEAGIESSAGAGQGGSEPRPGAGRGPWSGHVPPVAGWPGPVQRAPAGPAGPAGAVARSPALDQRESRRRATGTVSERPRPVRRSVAAEGRLRPS
jgi:hypothetical protein